MLLEEIVKYLYFAQVNKGREGVPDMDIAPELCLELLDVADYLDRKSATKQPQNSANPRYSLNGED